MNRMHNPPHAAISPDMALRLEVWLCVERGGNARVWLAEQSAFDLWQAKQRFKSKPALVKPAVLAAVSICHDK
jgi:plasmid maintenance system antidote protein VapI